ncbi:MAG TPA: hypothetical protein VN643_03355 [Pyrinomonadaceae bacterium]|nr:hypothetical protein [Pyrinomonadaceae bacterium]
MRLIIAVIILCRLTESVGAQVTRNSPPRAETTEQSELRLTTSILEQKYCSSGGMLLVVRFSYENTGTGSLIVFKYSSAPFQYRTSRNVAASVAKDYEQVVSPMMGSSSKEINFGAEPPADYFVVLKPGESFAPVNSVVVPVFVGPGKKENSGNDLKPGHHVLQVNVSTWPFNHTSQPKELGLRWHRFGKLFAAPILSQPMAFDVAEVRDRILVDCNAEQTDIHVSAGPTVTLMITWR